jgi:hypothetical protein
VAEGDVVFAVPLKQDLAALDVNLLDHPVDNGLVGRASDRGQIGYRGGVGKDDGSVPRGDQKLGPISAYTVASVDCGDRQVTNGSSRHEEARSICL